MVGHDLAAILQVTQYYMGVSGESGLPEGEEERQEKLNDLLDDSQVRLSCSIHKIPLFYVPAGHKSHYMALPGRVAAWPHMITGVAGAKRVSADSSACESSQKQARGVEAMQLCIASEAEELHVPPDNQVTARARPV